MYYSKQTSGFYTREIHGDNIPADAVEITPEQHAALLQGQSEGKVITADENGYPILIDPPQPTEAELFTRLRIERDARINSVIWMRERHADELALGKETTLTPEQYVDLLTYIQALRDLPAQVGAPWDGGGELTPWPELPSVR